MHGLRCTQCGDTRWTLQHFAPHAGADAPRCELCGGRMVPERRQPNHGPLHLAVERRDVTVTGLRPGGRPVRHG